MTEFFLVIIGIIIMYFFYRKWGEGQVAFGPAAIGGIVGLIIGSGIGIAGAFGAVNGAIIIGLIGFIISGLLFKGNKDDN